MLTLDELHTTLAFLRLVTTQHMAVRPIILLITTGACYYCQRYQYHSYQC